MKNKIIIILIILIVFIIIGIIRKLLGYSIKAKKSGKQVTATIIGYDYNLSYQSGSTNHYTLILYPVVRFIDSLQREQIARSKAAILLPVYKVGEKVLIDYYDDNSNISITRNISIGVFSNKVEEVSINKGIEFNIHGIKTLLDLILGVIILIIIICLK